MKLKDKWLTFLIITVVVIGIIVAVKLLPVWATIIAVFSLILGGVGGWMAKKIYDTYFNKD